MPKLVAVIVGVALAFPLWSQEKPKETTTTQPTFFSETIEVRVINVDAVVTDKKGQPVTGLTRNDFELYENGQKQEITNFLELSGAPPRPAVAAQPIPSVPGVTQLPAAASEPPADTRPRRIVLFLDNSAMRPFSRNRTLPAMKDFVARNLRGSDQVMIALWKPGLEIRLPFTNDVVAAQKAIDGLASDGALGTQLEVDKMRMEKEIRDLPTDYAMRGEMPSIDLGLAVCHQYAAQALHELHQSAEAIKGVISSMRGVEGRKAIILVTERLNDNPGREAFHYLEQIKDKFNGGPYTNFQAEEMAYVDHDIVPSISKLANSSGMTIYPIDAAGLAGETEGISAENLGDEAHQPTRMSFPMKVTYQTMAEIAAETGGSALTGSNNFKLAFDTVANDLNSYYSIGFRASGERKDTVRSLSVRLKNGKGYTVRTRLEFVEKSLLSEMNDAVAANLFFPIVRNDLSVKMTAGDGKTDSEEHLTIPLDIRIPTTALTLVPEGSDLTGHFSLYIAFVRKDGTVSKVSRQEQALRFPADSLGRRKEITVKTAATIDTKTEGVSVGVMDDYSHITGFAMLKLAPTVAPVAAGSK
jgi:VWFA-related protein